MIKNLPVNAGDEGLILGLGRYPGGGNGNLLLVGYSPWGHKELDAAEQLSTHAYLSLLLVNRI